MRKVKVMAVVFLFAFVLQLGTVASGAAESDGASAQTPFVPVYLSGSYGEFLQDNARTLDDIDGEVTVDVANPTSSSDNVSIETVAGRDGVLVMDETGYVEYTFEVQTAGLYVLGVDYCALQGKSGRIERSIYINGELQYDEAANASLDRIYIDDVADPSDHDNYFVTDSAGNQSRPTQKEIYDWVDGSYFSDSSGSYDGALKFKLERGVNTIRIESVRESVAISGLYFYTVSSSRSYSEWLTQMEQSGAALDGTELIEKIQAEYPYRKNNSQLYASTDRSSAGTEPPASNVLKKNTIGGENWDTVGQWVEYQVNVPKAGLYKLNIRYKQNFNSGLFSSREITVNGEYAFDESASVRFPYASGWETMSPKDSYGDDLLFYFEEGVNTIRIKAVMGDMAEIVNAVDNLVRTLQSDYRSILVITGSTPDENQDYNLDEVLPEVISDFRAQADLLSTIREQLESLVGTDSGQQSAQLRAVINDLYAWNEDPDSIPMQIDQINSDISTLGDFMMTCRTQPLEIDWIEVAEPEYKGESSEPNFFESFWHQVKLFFSSFNSSLNTISGEGHDEYADKATAWVVTSRDYAIVMRETIDRGFVDTYGIDLTLELYPGILTSSILAGEVSDAFLSLPQANVIDYAARDVLYPLNFFVTHDRTFTNSDTEQSYTVQVEGFNDIKPRFVSAMWGGATLEKETDISLTYGVPETVNFGVFYYRTDIVEEYGLEIPSTWEDYYDLIPVLQKYSMEIGAPAIAATTKVITGTQIVGLSAAQFTQSDFFGPPVEYWLYQMGGTKYKNGGREVNFDSELYLELFSKMNDFYTLYKCPIVYDAQNRFKSGEMPFIYGTMVTWTSLSVNCPEITGLWTMAPYPGVENDDGSINNVITPMVTYSVILADAANKDNAWTFIQWWTDASAQETYGREYESVTGQTAKYASANTEAFASAPWTAAELEVLTSQLQNLRPVEVCVGDYLSLRYLQFAQNEVIVDGSSNSTGIESILSHIREMNNCIENKREELDLPK